MRQNADLSGDMKWTVIHEGKEVAVARRAVVEPLGVLHLWHRDGSESYFAPGQWHMAYSEVEG